MQGGAAAEPTAAKAAPPRPPAAQAEAAQSAASPKKKDSDAAIQARPGGLHIVNRAGQAKPGDVVTFKVTAKLEPGLSHL